MHEAKWENPSPVRLILKEMTLKWTRQQRAIVEEDLTAYDVYVFVRHAGAYNEIIPLSENVNQMMALWIWTTATVFRIPLFSDSTLEKF